MQGSQHWQGVWAACRGHRLGSVLFLSEGLRIGVTRSSLRITNYFRLKGHKESLTTSYKALENICLPVNSCHPGGREGLRNGAQLMEWVGLGCTSLPSSKPFPRQGPSGMCVLQFTEL